MPSISQISSPLVVPRRKAAASMSTRVSTRGPLFEPERPPDSGSGSDTVAPSVLAPKPPAAMTSMNTSSRYASRVVGSVEPAVFQRSLARASSRGATWAHCTSSQEKAPRTPPSGHWCQRKWRRSWTRARRVRSLSVLRAALDSREAASPSSWCDAPASASSKRVLALPGAAASVSPSNLSWEEERSPPWRASVRAWSPVARVAAANRPLATPDEEPAAAASQSAAEPWPSLAWAPVSTTLGA